MAARALQKRTERPDYRIVGLSDYHFDKTKLVKQVAAHRPDVVVIRECAAYFPSDQAKFKSLVKTWVSQLQAAGIQPIVATTIPVTESHPPWMFVKQIIKR